MHASAVAELSRPLAYPAISLLLPIDDDPAETVRLRLDRLVTTAVDRLRMELDDGEVERFERLLRSAVDDVQVARGQQGVAVYVGDRTMIVPLSVNVRERVVIDDTFATRDVVRAFQRSPRYRVVVLGPRRTSVYDGVGLSLAEVDSEALGQVGTVGADARSPRSAARGRVSRDLRRGGSSRVTTDAYLRSLDAVLDPMVKDEARPMILVGSEPRLSAVAGSSRHRELIIGTARGARDVPNREDLARLVWPIVETMLGRQTAEAVAELEGVGGGRRYASGLREVWMLAREGRGDLLLVEEGFEQPALLDPATGNAEPSDDRDSPGVVDDLVDEIIEAVLAARGRVHVVPDGTLALHERIAMKLRY